MYNSRDVKNYFETPYSQRSSVPIGEQVSSLDFGVAVNKNSLRYYAQHLHDKATANLTCHLRPTVIDQDFQAAGQIAIKHLHTETVPIFEIPIYLTSISYINSKTVTDTLCKKVNYDDISILIDFVNCLDAMPIVTMLTLNYTLIVMLGPSDFISMHHVLTSGDNLRNIFKDCILSKQAQENYASFDKFNLKVSMPLFGLLLFGGTALILNSSIDPNLIHKATSFIGANPDSISASVNSITLGSSDNPTVVLNILKQYTGIGISKLFSSMSLFSDLNDSTMAFIKAFFKKK